VELRQRRCSCCGADFVICRSCDRGHRYCSRTCSMTARAESMRRARRKHRASREGRADHRDAERLRRARLKQERQGVCVSIPRWRVADHTSGKFEIWAKLAAMNMKPEKPQARRWRDTLRCIVCGRKTGASRRPLRC